jgi:hypothetical protein
MEEEDDEEDDDERSVNCGGCVAFRQTIRVQ